MPQYYKMKFYHLCRFLQISKVNYQLFLKGTGIQWFRNYQHNHWNQYGLMYLIIVKYLSGFPLLRVYMLAYAQDLLQQ